MIDNRKRFVIEEYHKKSVFASFLPGISGICGIPMWCYYVNRGQAVTSFGVMDKEHSMMEFYPAHQAYQRTETMGFRTFLKVNGRFAEAFTGDGKKEMAIGMNELEISHEIAALGLEIHVVYYILPEENLGGLVRQVSVTNRNPELVHIEVADGMAEVIPHGVSLSSMKEMGQTAKAWMEVKNHKLGLPYFKVRASMDDTAQVTAVVEGNFAFGCTGQEEGLPVIVNRENLFSYDTALLHPVHFMEKTVSELLEEEQMTQNEVPCCFFLKAKQLEPGETLTLYEVYGHAAEEKIVENLCTRAVGDTYFAEKRKRAEELVKEVTDRIGGRTGSPLFDGYSRQSYLDNVLRGGYPMKLPGDHLFYVYSRKHGDIERDYNFFQMLPEFYSQGNGNFRDVNQNRRSDVLFSPFVGDSNIKLFYECIQIDGYNPLGIEKMTFHVTKADFQDCFRDRKKSDELEQVLVHSFTPGKLYELLSNLYGAEAEELFAKVMNCAKGDHSTRFLEGYWSDHWTYNLDLVEAYLAVFPEKEETLLFGIPSYRYKSSCAGILPRRKRYHKTENGIRQYSFLQTKKTETEYLTDQNGTVVYSTLAEKLLLLCILKTAALDACGMGIEMEGGKPGWYDALNGLPGILGSSMAETYELSRMISFLTEKLKQHSGELRIPEELAALAASMEWAAEKWKHEICTEEYIIEYWNAVNDAKETYREKTDRTVSGTVVSMNSERAIKILETLSMVVNSGIEKAVRIGGGVSPTYFSYEVTDFEEDGDGILPLAMKRDKLPDFLEGPVRHFKLNLSMKQKRNLYESVKSSELYDEKLQMYRVNSSLQESSIELGRARAFTPGWLENGSIWLHMEYKYLLELLKSGLYPEFIQDFHNAAIPFLKEEMYGRSLMENSSFLASSVNPNAGIHGKGFVARLSGSTAEFLQMWQIMMFGKNPFVMDQGSLQLNLEPVIPSYLIGEDQKIEAVFLGTIPCEYHLPDRNDLLPGNYKVAQITVTKADDSAERTDVCRGALCEEIRSGQVKGLEVTIVRA